jgi:hypothetical protein
MRKQFHNAALPVSCRDTSGMIAWLLIDNSFGSFLPVVLEIGSFSK